MLKTALIAGGTLWERIAADAPIDERCFITAPRVADSRFVQIAPSTRGRERRSLRKRAPVQQKARALKIGVGGRIVAQLRKARAKKNLGGEAIAVSFEPHALGEQKVESRRRIGRKRNPRPEQHEVGRDVARGRVFVVQRTCLREVRRRVGFPHTGGPGGRNGLGSACHVPHGLARIAGPTRQGNLPKGLRYD